MSDGFSVFTVCNLAYLPKALVLADSLNRVHGKALHVFLFDERRELGTMPCDIKIHWIEEIGVPKWRELAFMYDIIEFSTSIKPFIALRLLEQSGKVIFLDPDTAIYSELNPILDDLDSFPVLLTPHHIKPQPDTVYESDLAMMRFGSFNLGFFAVNSGPESRAFLQWWNRRCLDFSFMESQSGLSTDQKWVTIAPCLFEFLKVSFNPGYNAAPWNTFERQITSVVDGRYTVNEQYPLVFFHFSNFDHRDPQYKNKRASNEINESYDILERLGTEYSLRLRAREAEVGKPSYSFDYMSDGSYISPTLRRAYACMRDAFPVGHDPFDASGAVGRFARKNSLVSSGRDGKYIYPGVKEAAKHGRTLAAIYVLMRLFLRVFGPNRFYDLSKLMVYLSSYRLHRRLWRL